MEPIFNTLQLVSTSIGAKIWLVSSTPKNWCRIPSEPSSDRHQVGASSMLHQKCHPWIQVTEQSCDKPMPALLTRISRRAPVRSATLSTQAFKAVESVTSSASTLMTRSSISNYNYTLTLHNHGYCSIIVISSSAAKA